MRHMRRRDHALGGALFLIALVAARTVHADDDEGRKAVGACGSVFNNRVIAFNDYRTGQSDPDYYNVLRFHLEPARTSMRQGNYSFSVLDDLNFILKGWPNHVPALESLVQYELGGGRSGKLPTARCYFSFAREFAPDDVAVLVIEAYYFWRKGQKTVARDIYEEALGMDPDSIELHYNLGLAYLETGEPQRALEQARIAYAGGYPLPGLRNKLRAAGVWEETEQTETAAQDAPR